MGTKRIVFDSEDIKIPGVNLLGYSKSTMLAGPLIDHVHENCIEVVVLIKGIESYNIANHCYTVKGGEAFYSHINQYHRNEKSQGISEYYWFQLDMSVSKNFLGLCNIYAKEIKNLIFNRNEHILYVNKRGIFLLKEIFESVERGNTIYAQGLFVSFLFCLFHEYNVQNEKEKVILKALEYIDEHIYDILSITDICNHCNLSISGLKHKFKEYTGETPRAYINKIKIERAKELLKQGKSITETSMILSFNSSDYFSVVFRKYSLQSPTEFKNEAKKS